MMVIAVVAWFASSALQAPLKAFPDVAVERMTALVPTIASVVEVFQ
jgi:hypothetical protein